MEYYYCGYCGSCYKDGCNHWCPTLGRYISIGLAAPQPSCYQPCQSCQPKPSPIEEKLDKIISLLEKKK